VFLVGQVQERNESEEFVFFFLAWKKFSEGDCWFLFKSLKDFFVQGFDELGNIILSFWNG